MEVSKRSKLVVSVEGEDEEMSMPTSPPVNSKRFTKRQWVLVIVFAVMNTVSTMTYSLQAPFYPAEAERKGATATEYGFVFGIYEFTVFIMSPIFGKYMNKLGPATVFNVCVVITSSSVICFGLLDRIDDRTTFIALSLLCRFFEGFGCGGFLPATFTIIACEFPDSVATVFASLETFAGLGIIIGPTVGEALYSIGGFPLPFHVAGMIFLLSALVCSFVIPEMNRATNEDGTDQAGYSIWTLLKIPPITFAFFTLVIQTISMGFVSALLEPHIRQFGLTSMQTGLMFIIIGGTYSVTTPIWGYICDRIKKPIYVTIFGTVLTFTAFLFIGPAPFIPFETMLWATITGLILQGLGFACGNVSVFAVGLKESVSHGLPDNMATNSAVSGLWQSMMSLGAWIGPVVAGVLYDNIGGFRNSSWLILGTSFAMGCILIIHECFYKRKHSNMDEEFQPLLIAASSLRSYEAGSSGGPRKPGTSTSTYGSAT